jgi:phage gp29-like protein
MEAGGWLVTAGDGLMEACSVAYLYKNLPLRDWLSCSEKFGMPGIVGRTDATLDSPEWNEFAAAIKDFSQDWSAVFNRSNSIELIEPKNQGEGMFASLVDKMDRAMTALWRGGDLSTMSVRNAAGASLQQNEADILEMDDAQMISETLTTQVSRYVLQYHFGDAPALAYFKLRAGNKRDVELDLKVDEFLVQSGAPMAAADALARYDRPLPDAGEALLKPAATPVAIESKEGLLASLDNQAERAEGN